MDSAPLTCTNMHLPRHARGHAQDNCQPGCVCVAGFVWNKDDQKCVTAEQCPCHHGGKSYTDGEVLQQDCKTCTCSENSWICEDKECRSQCRAYGDSHLTTFDGVDYRFQGDCEYVLAQAKDASWRITVRNAPCGTTGTVCAKVVKFTLHPHDRSMLEEVQLVKGKPIRRCLIG